MEKPAFDPSQPFQAAEKPAFDPAAPYQVADTAASSLPPPISRGESFGRGALKQAGFGLQKTLEPYAERGFAKLLGNPQTEDLYSQLSNQDLSNTVEQQNADAQKANPGHYFAGSLAGAAPAMIASAGAGAAMPAVRGVGVGATLANSALKAAPAASLFGVQGFSESNAPTLAGRAQEGLQSGAIAGLGGELSSGALNIAGEGLSALPSALKTIFSKIRGISPETIDLFMQHPEMVKHIEDLGGGDIQKGLNLFSQEVADETNAARSRFVQGANQNIDQRISALQNERVPASRLTQAIGQSSSEIAPEGVAVTPAYESAQNTIPQTNERILSSADEEGMLSPSQINTMRKQFNQSSKAIYSGKSAEPFPVAKTFQSGADEARNILGELDPEINAQNQLLASSLRSQQALNRYGLNEKYGVDANKLQGLLTSGPSVRSKVSSDVANLDQLFGSNLAGAQTQAIAAKELNPEGIYGKIATGYSAIPLIGAGVAGSMHNPLAAAGALGVAALQSPVTTKTLLRGASVASEMFGPSFGQFTDLLSKSPSSFGEYAGPLLEAAKKGPGALIAHDFVMSNQYPEYRAKKEELLNQGDQNAP